MVYWLWALRYPLPDEYPEEETFNPNQGEKSANQKLNLRGIKE
jgi:hypothetical protein